MGGFRTEAVKLKQEYVANKWNARATDHAAEQATGEGLSQWRSTLPLEDRALPLFTPGESRVMRDIEDYPLLEPHADGRAKISVIVNNNVDPPSERPESLDYFINDSGTLIKDIDSGSIGLPFSLTLFHHPTLQVNAENIFFALSFAERGGEAGFSEGGNIQNCFACKFQPSFA